MTSAGVISFNTFLASVATEFHVSVNLREARVVNVLQQDRLIVRHQPDIVRQTEEGSVDLV
jgi:hypothetical protein